MFSVAITGDGPAPTHEHPAPMRSIPTAFLLAASLGAWAQTHFYVNSIQVQPAQPTDQDPVSIALSGDLSSSGAFIVSSSASVSGNTVVLDVVAADPGGLAVLVPHTETVVVGQLPVGTYSIQMNGTAVADLAPPVQHAFTVSGSGGSPCDSVEVTEVAYHTFDPGRLLLTSYNGSSELFPYPGFILFDANDDTLGVEVVNYFGLAGTTLHELAVHPQAVLPVGSFSGSADLWVDFGDSLACSLPVGSDLCPDTTCTELLLTLTNTGGMMVTAGFTWQLLDAQQNVLASGAFDLDSQGQADTAALCLPPGGYQWSLFTQGNPGGQLYLSVVDPAHPGLDTTAIFQQGVVNELPFSVHLACSGSTNVVSEQAAGPGLQLAVRGDRLQLLRPGDAPIGGFAILDLGGRVLRSGRVTRPAGTIDLAGTPSGIYVFRCGAGAVRFVYTRP